MDIILLTGSTRYPADTLASAQAVMAAQAHASALGQQADTWSAAFQRSAGLASATAAHHASAHHMTSAFAGHAAAGFAGMYGWYWALSSGFLWEYIKQVVDLNISGTYLNQYSIGAKPSTDFSSYCVIMTIKLLFVWLRLNFCWLLIELRIFYQTNIIYHHQQSLKKNLILNVWKIDSGR